MSFHEVRFPAALSFGATGGPERRTEIVTLANGFEERNTPWAQSRRRYDAGIGLRSLDEVAEVLEFFEARRGPLHGFLWKDWLDCTSTLPSGSPSALDQAIGSGDGDRRSFQLIKRYGLGETAYERQITKPIASTVRIAVDGVELASGAGYTVDAATGEVEFDTAPETGAVVTAGFEFDVPVRFDTEMIQAAASTFRAGGVPEIPVVEIRL